MPRTSITVSPAHRREESKRRCRVRFFLRACVQATGKKEGLKKKATRGRGWGCGWREASLTRHEKRSSRGEERRRERKREKKKSRVQRDTFAKFFRKTTGEEQRWYWHNATSLKNNSFNHNASTMCEKQTLWDDQHRGTPDEHHPPSDTQPPRRPPSFRSSIYLSFCLACTALTTPASNAFTITERR